MQIEHLAYCGNREEGTLTVTRVDVLSPFRKLKFYKGLRLEVGKMIPPDIAKIIAKDYPDVFKLERKELGDKDAYVYHISDLIEECLAVMDDRGALEVVEEIVAKYFGGYEITKKAVEVAEKKKPTKRRRTK
ncbi:MAG: hypothetical protein ACWGQW_14775 [bacterium]